MATMISRRLTGFALALAAFAAGCSEGRHEPSDAVMQQLLLPRIAEFFAPSFPADADPDDVAAARADYEALVPAYRAARLLEFRKIGCEKKEGLYNCEFYFQADAGKLGLISTQQKVAFVYRDGRWIAGSARHGQ
jgi:hypothetical protein